MFHNPEAFNLIPPPSVDTGEPLAVHDAEAMRRLVEHFSVEMDMLASGCGLDRPTGESGATPAEVVFGTSRDRAREANRTSANAYLESLALDGSRHKYRSFIAVQERRMPADVLSWPSFREGHALAKRVLGSPEDNLLFQSLNIYSDLGKTDAVLLWAQTVDSVKDSRDHDQIMATLLQPEHADAWPKLVPSFMALSVEQQQSIRNMIGCDFHLPQLNNGQALPSSLEQFYKLTPKEKQILLLQEVFDIGGAQGDTVINGTMTLNESMYRRLRGQIAILLSDKNAHLPAQERAQKDYEEILAFHGQRFGLEFDSECPDVESRAFVRFATMFRDLSAEQLQQIPRLFRENLNPVTQAHMLDFLNATGYETDDRGAIMSMYSSTVAAKLLSSALREGFPFDQAMTASMQLIARLNAAVRVNIDITDTPVTHVVARDLMVEAEKDWTRLLTHDIVAVKTVPGQAHFVLRKQPTVVRELGDERVTQLGSPANLNLPTNNGLWIAGGGGGDSYTTAFLANDVFEQQNPTIVSVWGEPDKIANAVPLGDTGRIFQVTPETTIANTRYMEHFVAARGIRTILLCLQRSPDGTSNVEDDLKRVANMLDQPLSHVTLVDTGGDIMERSSLLSARPARDHISLHAAWSLLQNLGYTVPGKVLVAAPGIDAPGDMNDIAHRAGMQILDLSPYSEAFLGQVKQDGLMTDNPAHYSRMIQSLFYSLDPRRAHVVQPLLLPLREALKKNRARPSHVAVTPQMGQLHTYSLEDLAQAIGM